MIFIYISFFLMLCSYFNSNILFKLSVLITASVFSLSYGYGYDWMNYYTNYLSIKNTLSSPYEPGIFYLMKIVSYLGGDFSTFMLIVSAFMYWCAYLFCKDLKCPTFGFFCLFSFLGFYMYSEQIRQGLALSVILLGIRNGRWRNNTLYFYIAVAMFFHITSAFCFIYKFLYSEKEGGYLKRFIYLTVAIFFILFLFSNPSYVYFLPYVYSKLSGYNEGYGANATNIIEYILQSRIALVYLIFSYLLYLCYKQSKNKDIIMSIMSVYFLFLTKLSFFLLRFGYFCVPYFVIGIDSYYERKLNRGVVSFYKISILMILFLISTIPMWKEAYRDASLYHINFSDTRGEILSVIGRKCTIIEKTDYGNGLFSQCN